VQGSRSETEMLSYFRLRAISRAAALRNSLQLPDKGDWHLHLYTVKQMLPYLHEAGHIPYDKSARLYVQPELEPGQNN